MQNGHVAAKDLEEGMWARCSPDQRFRLVMRSIPLSGGQVRIEFRRGHAVVTVADAAMEVRA